MKDLLVTIVQSMFKYILNPTVWSRVASDINTSQSDDNATPIQRTSDSDIRDINISKVLDLANVQMKLLLENKKLENTQNLPSGVEVLAVTACDSKKCDNILSPSSSTDTASRMEPSESTDSYEEFELDEIHESHKISHISVNDSLPSTVSITDVQQSELSSELSERMSCDRSDLSSLLSSNSAKLSSDSVEILSISSDTTSS